MNNEEYNKLKNEEHFNNKINYQSNDNEQSNEDTNYSENNYNESYKEESRKEKIKQFDKPLKVFGGICIAIGIAAIVLSGSNTVDSSASAQNALANKVSTAVPAGTILLTSDENGQAKDYTISHNSNDKETKIWVWDYAAEDGDYVQVLVDGNPIGEVFMIKHKPKEITVPATGNVQIKGIKDGGGGITYAVRYDINGTSYFNSAPEGEANTYTLVKE